jgi:hypothetical protein
MAATFVCPKGDQSDDPEYCSVCGTRIDGATGVAATDSSTERCPSCGVQRTPGARFCETCRYDFKTPTPPVSAPALMTSAPDPEEPGTLTPRSNTSSISPAAVSGGAETGVAAEPVAATRAPTRPATAQTRFWEAIVSVDPALDVESDPDTPCPTGSPERTFPLDLAENLIGRRSPQRGILPSIALNDPGVSHRHLMVYRSPEATLMISDLGSSNGTFLSGSHDRLEPGVKTSVADGDQIELGRWTRITFRCTS